MLLEQAAELTLTDAQPLGEPFDACIIAVERAISDQGKPAQNRVRRTAPCAELRRRLRSATQAGAEPRLSGGSRRCMETAILELWRSGRPARTTVDSCP